jgi:hypothetical protein
VVIAMKWFKDPADIEEDRQLFARSESVLGEAEMEMFLATLKEEKAYQSELRTRIVGYLRHFENGGQAFRDRKLQEKAKGLATALQELKALTAAHFLLFPRNQTGPDYRYFLHPDYFVLEMTDVSIDEHRFHLKTEQDLTRMVDRTTAAYRDFRALARKRLEA